MRTMEETREATLAGRFEPKYGNIRERRNDAKPNPNTHAAPTDIPVLDLLLDDRVPIEPGSTSRILTSILNNIRMRRNYSRRVSRSQCLRLTHADVSRTS